MTEKIIPQGYILEITTWENDGDAYRTERMEGLTEIEVKLYLAICRGFDCDGFGNDDRSFEDGPIQKFLEETYKAFGLPCNYDIVYDLIGSWADGQFYRVFDHANLYFTPAPITMQQLDAKTF